MQALNMNTMILRNRDELKSLFKNSSRLSEAHFAALIESMLNKRDDQFHGVWKPGQTYRTGDVVIWQGALWEMVAEGEICGKPDQPPSKDNPNWKSLIIPVEDNDWEVIEKEGVMWAKVFDKIGIGIGSFGDASIEGSGERPAARLDVRKLQQGRWLLFPEKADQTQFTLLHYETTNESSYLVTGLSLEEVNWLTDAAKGFVFRKGNPLLEEVDATELKPNAGQVLMVIKPKRIEGGTELATLGLNVEDPSAMFDITDKKRGQLLFTPDEKCDPALSIVNLDPECEKNYLALWVGKTEVALVSDASDRFVFRKGGEYGEYCHERNINQGNLLVIIRQLAEQQRAQVGIGTASPMARLDIKDGEQSQVQILPESSTATTGSPINPASPVISILNLIPTTQPTYLTGGLGNQVAGWVSNAKQGFVFRQGGLAINANQHSLVQGQTNLVIRENGYIGMGTEEPYTNLDIVNKSSSGRFLFNLDKKVNPALGILNLRPDTKNNYFTVGADNNHAILVTDSQYGFLFKFGVEYGTNDSQVDINQGFTLLSIRPDGKTSDTDRPGIVSVRPEGKGRLGIGKQPIDYELDVRGMTRTFTVYQDTNSNQISNAKPLTGVLEKVKLLQPITFRWNSATGFQEAGEQIGLLAHEVDDIIPQVIKTSSDGTQAIAYQNLVPVQIQALKELIAERDQTRLDLQTLRDEFTLYQQQMEVR
jgi:hypothetical protein